jgi:hypothetical protein
MLARVGSEKMKAAEQISRFAPAIPRLLALELKPESYIPQRTLKGRPPPPGIKAIQKTPALPDWRGAQDGRAIGAFKPAGRRSGNYLHHVLSGIYLPPLERRQDPLVTGAEL